MNTYLKLREEILSLFDKKSNLQFEDLCHQVFQYQAKNNKVYNQYLNLLGKDISAISSIDDIPLLPISLFKDLMIKTGNWKEEKIFLSSGTTSSIRSKSYLRSADWYNRIASQIFESVTGIKNVYILALLPSYIENGQSSLVHMVDHWMYKYNQGKKPFYTFDFEGLFEQLNAALMAGQRKILLIGVSFALIDFCEKYGLDSEKIEIMFTGGMKNKDKELTVPEIARTIRRSFPSSKIWSEYGMTELTSQAYAREDGEFRCGPTMWVVFKEITDPMSSCRAMKTGQLGVIDLANIDTLSFILTEDIGRTTTNGFHILGRMDNSDIRGCNLLYLS